MTREEASEAMEFVSDSRIEKFESGRSPVQPEEVLAMARLLTKMDEQPEYSRKIGVEDASYFRSEVVNEEKEVEKNVEYSGTDIYRCRAF